MTKVLAVFFGILTFVSVATISRVYAGFFLSVAAFSPTTSISNGLTNTDSQNMPLLEAPVNAGFGSVTLPTVTPISSQILALADVGAGTPQLIDSDNVGSSSDATSSSDASNAISTYTVQSGDTIGGIAEKFDISVNTILWANNLNKKSTIKIGQKLVILPISGVKYTVKPGDTLSSIAKSFKGNQDDIMSFNGLVDGDSISPGDVLIIPDGEMSAAATPVQSPSSSHSSISIDSGASASLINKNGMIFSPDGFYMRPIKGGEKTQGIHGNNAVDLAEACGTPIYASASGTVIVSKDNGAWNGGYGNYVVISHNNGTQTLYAHMRTVEVSMGDTTTQGQEIGKIGNTGDVTGPTGCHVHFEIRHGEVNPF